MLTLNKAEHEQFYYFEEVVDGRSSERHLSNLGFVKGAKIRIISSSKKGDYIILVQGARLAISEEVASKIVVTKEAPVEIVAVKSLNTLKAGDVGVVTQIAGQGVIRRRLMDMGLTRGVEVSVRKVAPLGDPIEITVRGYELTLRKSEAALVHLNY